MKKKRKKKKKREGMEKSGKIPDLADVMTTKIGYK